MSIINQMLRDLDARGTAASDLPAPRNADLARTTLSGVPWAMVLPLLLATGGAIAYFVWSGTSNERPPPAPAALAKPAAESRPIAVAPQPLPEAPPPSKQANVAVAMKPPAVQLTQSEELRLVMVRTKPVVPAATTVPNPAQTQPAVVKKMVELTPEAEALQFHDDAQALRRAGKVDAAIGRYRQALERNPGMRNARLQLAGLLQENGQTDAALHLLKTGYEQQPNDALAIAAGRILADQGRRDEALGWLERGRNGLRASDQALRGALLSHMQRFDEAVKAYQLALSADPDQGGWLLGLGLALESLGRVDEARAAYRNALERGEFKPEVVKFLQQKSGTSGQ